MTAQDALRRALRDTVGPALRSAGFTGSAPTWRLRTDVGDWAVVNVQSSPWSTRDGVRCIVNIAVAPEPHLAWQAHRRDHLPSPHDYRTTKVVESDGLFRDRLEPGSKPDGAGEQWWEVVDDETARSVVGDIVLRLERTELPRLTSLLDRERMLAAVRAHDLGDVRGDGWTRYFLEAEAILLADRGPSAELDTALGAATTHWSDPWTDRERLLHDWVLARARRAPGVEQSTSPGDATASSSPRDSPG